MVRERFEQDYIFEVYKKIQINSVGPIFEIVTSVIRKSDGKLLGKAISLRSHKGWLNTLAALGQTPGGETCPSGQDEEGFTARIM